MVAVFLSYKEGAILLQSPSSLFLTFFLFLFYIPQAMDVGVTNLSVAAEYSVFSKL